MLLTELLVEKKKEEKEKKIIYPENLSELEPFPNDTIAALKKAISKEAKDLEKTWNSPMELVDFTFQDFSVPKPPSYRKERWQQYLKLLKGAVEDLRDARGFSDWTTS